MITCTEMRKWGIFKSERVIHGETLGHKSAVVKWMIREP